MRVERGPSSPLFSSYDPFSSRFLVGFCHLQTHLTASLRGQNVLGGEALLLCSTFTCLQHPILLYYMCCIKTGTTENLSLPTTRVREHQNVILMQTHPQEDSFHVLIRMCRFAVWKKYTDISEEPTASIFRKSQAIRMLSYTLKSIRSTISFATVPILWSSGRVIARCNVAAGHHRFGGKYSLHPQGTK